MSNWIKTKDRLPELGKMVILFPCDIFENFAVRNNEVCQGFMYKRNKSGELKFKTFALNTIKSKITHWIPLPNKPEVEKL